MERYICKECGFKVKRNSEPTKLKCPYCGKGYLKKEPSAEELIDE